MCPLANFVCYHFCDVSQGVASRVKLVSLIVVWNTDGCSGYHWWCKYCRGHVDWFVDCVCVCGSCQRGYVWCSSLWVEVVGNDVLSSCTAAGLVWQIQLEIGDLPCVAQLSHLCMGVGDCVAYGICCVCSVCLMWWLVVRCDYFCLGGSSWGTVGRTILAWLLFVGMGGNVLLGGNHV